MQITGLHNTNMLSGHSWVWLCIEPSRRRHCAELRRSHTNKHRPGHEPGL